MAQSPGGRVIASDESARIAAGLFIPGDELVVDATMVDFMAGDSRVFIRTGRANNGSSMWVPTIHIRHRSALMSGAAPIWNGGEIPDYNVLDVMRHIDDPYWDWRLATKR